jgi:dTMP kinase
LIAAWHNVVYRTLIAPAALQNCLFIADGWLGKYTARFLLKPDFDSQRLAQFFSDIPLPDLGLFLDLPPSIAARRRDKFKPSECGSADGHLGTNHLNFVGYQTLVRDQLVGLGREYRWQTIIADRPPEAILRDVLDSLGFSSV